MPGRRDPDAAYFGEIPANVVDPQTILSRTCSDDDVDELLNNA